MVIRNLVFKAVARIFIPGIAKAMQEEGRFDLNPEQVSGEIDYSNYLHIEDNGSDVTIFSFAGAAVLFAGMPQFEFRKLLADHSRGYNLVFVRDPHRAAYTKAPDGSNTGLEFYTGLVQETIERLGSTHNIGIGASAGGAGAFFIGSQVPFQQIVTFAPAFPQDVYIKPENRRKTFFNFKALLTEPKAYLEVLFVTLAAMYVWRTVCRTIGEENVPDITKQYLDMKPRPRAVIFYGERCLPDSDQASRHAHIPTIHLRPVDSGRHNCAADLKKKGLLGKAIMEEIETGLAEWRAHQAAQTPAYAKAEGL